ncbi:MAG: VCBS repeat-containing protein [Pirellulaceae bacterium]
MLFGATDVLVVLNADDKGTNRHLTDVEQPTWDTLGDVVDIVAYDLDHDSDSDLVVATDRGPRILLNSGAALFTDVSSYSSLESKPLVEGLQVVDWDRDLDLDILCCDGSRAYLLENVLYGRFRQRPLEELGSRDTVERLLVLEADGSPSWDVLLRQAGAGKLALTRTTPEGVTITQEKDSLANLERAARTEDLDNDGVQDLIEIFNDKLEIAQGLPVGGFQRTEPLTESVTDAVTSFDVIDWDGDGRLDLLIGTADGVQLRRNTTSSGHAWWSLKAIGAKDQTGRVSRDGVGTLVEIVVDGRYQAKVVRGQRTHLGLGSSDNVGAVRLIWTNGMPQGVINPSGNTSHAEQVFLKGSCPFLYTWDGEKFVFVTDCLWAAPIGLPAAKYELVPSREWEYLKVPGELLQADEAGRYRIMLTEELWEAAYFDHVRLIAVDHPAEVRVESNEKVGPPSIAQYKIHTIARPRRPLGAWDVEGRDVSEIVATADANFYRGFQERIVQGLTEEHFLELDLGDLSDANQVTLFLTGWLHPTDSSLNVSFVEHPTRDAPRPPEIQVRDESGNWVTSPVPMGFPGGKTKTIAVDLSHLMPRADGRLRIVSTAEVYWDEVFFTVDEEPVDLRTTTMEVSSATLEFRGFSAREPRQPNGPERFDYAQVDAGPWWPPMRGRFTRYGDVSELVQAADHRMVVMGSGDQLALVFDGPTDPPPAGWTRDFLLYSVGWDKDADLNTMQGQHSEPLPFAGMTDYPYGADAMDWTRPELMEYQREYLTRRSKWYEFWSEPFRTIENGSSY